MVLNFSFDNLVRKSIAWGLLAIFFIIEVTIYALDEWDNDVYAYNGRAHDLYPLASFIIFLPISALGLIFCAKKIKLLQMIPYIAIIIAIIFRCFFVPYFYFADAKIKSVILPNILKQCVFDGADADIGTVLKPCYIYNGYPRLAYLIVNPSREFSKPYDDWAPFFKSYIKNSNQISSIVDCKDREVNESYNEFYYIISWCE